MKGNWIHTYTGKRFSFDEPTPDMVDIIDIAHALSLLPRYCGHTARPYTVAQHSVLVSTIVPPMHRLWGLLHDAAEAYVNDLSRPVKQYMRKLSITDDSPFDDLEQMVMDVIVVKFKLDSVEPKCVKDADNTLLCTERRDLFNNPQDWHHITANGYEVLPYRITSWKHKAAEDRFLERFLELGGTA